MAAATRFVERLHLRADSESAVRRILPCLEDAFRTATLPDTVARLIFVRRLHLGRLPRGASAQSLSLAIESRFSGGDWRPVHAAAAGAVGAPAVWFRDALEAHEMAALRTVTGQPIEDWFWPLAIRALARSSPADTLRTLAFSVASLEEAPAALPAWTRSVVRAGHVGQLLAALQPGDGTALLRAAGIAVSPPTVDGWIDHNPAPSPHRAAPNGLERNDVRSSPVWREARDDRHEFVEQMLGGSASSDVLPRQHATISRSEPRSDLGLVNQSDSASASKISVESRTLLRRAFSSGQQPPEQLPEPHDGFHPGREALGERSRSASEPIEAARRPRPFIDATATAAGGLIFLVPVLERLGFPEWCADRQARAETLARQIFRVLLSRLGVAADDPAWMIAATPDDAEGQVPLSRGSRAPATATPIGDGWLPPSGGRTSRIPPNPIPEIWLSGCRRLLRRRVRIGLATLVLRPARLMLTTTHVDVFFPLNAADVRVRRAGLDRDPGWVPWVRRVVSFHYGEHAFQDIER